MPKPGNRWRHLILSTRSSWHHGDPRGFRSRAHRIHSSGDYRNPPPEGEHAALLSFRKSTSAKEVTLPKKLRPPIGRAILQYLKDRDYDVLTVAIAKVHAHILVELPDNIVKIKMVIGQLKRAASLATQKELPGSIWARGGGFKPVKSRAHHQAAYEYILYDQGTTAWTWSFKDGSDEGRFRRKRKGPK